MRREKSTPSWKPIGKRILKGSLYTFFALTTLALILIVGGIGVGAGIVSAMVKNEKIRTQADFKEDFNSLGQNSYAYFQNKGADGKPIKIGSFKNDGKNSVLVRSINDVSKDLVNAFIAIEDHEFYDHNGIVPRSLLRAAYQQATNADVQTGGSTITQQLVKNVILEDRGQNLQRKAKEIVIAIRLDSMFEKNDILTYYMNSVYFGKGADGRHMYGVQAAASGLFNTNAKDLKLAQAAYIAGMVQRPNDLNPLSKNPKNLQAGLERMKLVLSKMLEQNKITKQQYDAAIKFDIKGSLAKPEDFSNNYEAYPFIMYGLEDEVAEALMEKDGLDIQKLSKEGKYRVTLNEYKNKFRSRGYHIYTTIDQKMYDAINKEATKHLSFHKRSYNGKEVTEQLGAVLLDNKTGAVLAFVSGKDFKQNEIDHALNATNQPGSAIKPLLVYGPAIEERVISPDTLILDDEMPRSDGSGYYKNANGKYAGPVPAIQALKYSYNIPAIKVFNKLGHQTGFEYLRKLGLPPHPNDGEAAAIGGATNGYTVEKVTAAFATFANEGNYNKPYMIAKITDSDGKVVWEHKTQPLQVFSPQTAYQTTRMLREVVRGGTAAEVIGRNIKGYDLAGKTGTSNGRKGSSSFEKDLWFVGYTPQVTLGVWGGYDFDVLSMSHNKNFSKQAWVNIFKAAAAANPAYFDKSLRFKNPGGYIGGIKCIECDEIEAYLKKKEEEQKKKEEEEKKNQNPNNPGNPNNPTNPGNPGDPGNPDDGKPNKPGHGGIWPPPPPLPGKNE